MKLLRPVHNSTVPFEQEIRGAFAGRLIYVFGKVPENAGRFAINVMAGEDVALHFNPRFTENAIVRNSKINGAWGSEDKDGGLPLKKGDVFDVTIQLRKRFFTLLINGRHFDNYRYRTDLKNIKNLQISGDVQIKRIQFEVRNLDWQPAMIIEMPENSRKHEVPYANMTDHKLVVTGTPTGGRFSINFVDKNGNILYHFNPRDDTNMIVGNSKFNGSWQREEVHNGYPFHQDTPYMVEIAVKIREYKATVNGAYQLSYDHRNGKPFDIAHVTVEGATDVNKIKFI